MLPIGMDRTVRPKDTQRVDPPRLWTAEDAGRRVGELSDLLPRLKGWVVRLGEVHQELERLAAFWGANVDAADHVDHELKARLDAEWGNLSRRLEEAVTALRTEGIEVKDLESGTVDFYGELDGDVVFFCWQRGEPHVEFYHPVTGSYKDRRPIPERARSPSSPRSRP